MDAEKAEQAINTVKMQAESYIQRFLSDPFEFSSPGGVPAEGGRDGHAELWEAVKYVMTAPGKRIRPILVLTAGKMLSVPVDKTLSFLLAIEYLHNSTLVHDDLPALDNDDYRRGKPTCHKVYGEGVALMAGNAMTAKAFSVIAADNKLEDAEKVQLIGLLSDAYYEICLGQVLDLKKPDETQSIKNRRKSLEFKHLRKTGALFIACLQGMLLLSPYVGDAEAEKSILEIGENLGLLFQATDDILDSISDEQTGSSRDEILGIDTYVTIFGADLTKQIAQDLAANTKQALDYFGESAEELKGFVDYILRRDR